jgi:hypothetical protein
VVKLAPEIAAEVVKDVTLDTFLDRHPSTLKFPEDYEKLVVTLRSQRAQWVTAQEKKKAKKEGVEDAD